jgi:transposase
MNTRGQDTAMPVLLIPEYDPETAEPYTGDIQPGEYDTNGLVELLREHAHDPRVAEDVLAEMGSDMSRFPTAAHLASWARLCPGNKESGGKRISGATSRGNPWLRSALVEAAWMASRSKGTYLSARFKRISIRRGAKRAALAVAHTILVTMYHMISCGSSYHELGGNYFDSRDVRGVIRRSVRRIENLGFKVSIEPV